VREDTKSTISGFDIEKTHGVKGGSEKKIETILGTRPIARGKSKLIGADFFLGFSIGECGG